MNPKRWEQTKQLFEAALDLPENQRAAYVQNNSTDAVVRAEVLRLLYQDQLANPDFLGFVTGDAGGLLARAARLMSTTDFSPAAAGNVLSGRYEIVRELGSGGSGVVYLARDKSLHDRPVVVKFLFRGSETEIRLTRKFQQEIEALARIRHPGVVEALDAGNTEDGRVFLVMEYVEGSTLRSFLDGPIGCARAANLIVQMADALAAAHAAGVLHRDLKPENVMLQRRATGEESIKLIDFGIARLEDSRAARTLTSTVVGTVDYMAPEQLMGKTSVATDIFALGVIAYEMLTGRRPFDPKTPFALYELQKAERIVRPSRVDPAIPCTLDQVVLRALSFDSAHRQTSVEQFGREISAALAKNRLAERRWLLPVSTAALIVIAGTLISPATWGPALCHAWPGARWCPAKTPAVAMRQEPSIVSPAAAPLSEEVDALSLKLHTPIGLARDSKGNLYISDYGNHVLRKVTAAGRATIIAGTGSAGFTGNGGPAVLAQLHFPRALALDGDKYLYVSEPLIGRVRRIDLTTGIITHVMGDGVARFSGDGMAGTATSLGEVLGLAVDKQGNLIVSDTGNQTIRKLSAVDGKVSTIAGTGTIGRSPDGTRAAEALLNRPGALAIAPDGDLYVSDIANYIIQRIRSGVITTAVGNPRSKNVTGPALQVSAQECLGMAVGSDGGGLYFTDEATHTLRLLDFSTQQVTLIAGQGHRGFSGDRTPALGAALGNPNHIVIEPDGLLIAEASNGRIRRIIPGGLITTVAGGGHDKSRAVKGR